ncbi:MAG: response regulator transcription factor, partial [Phocaeicola sp.]
CYAECYKALEKVYSASKPNYPHYRYKMAHRFIRCNCGELDTYKFDLDEFDNLFLEQVKCPLRGSEDCPYEGIICMPKRTSLIKGRQLEVASKLAEGLSMQQIADALFISIHTVHNIVAQIKFRLQVENSGQIINWYNKIHNQ